MEYGREAGSASLGEAFSARENDAARGVCVGWNADCVGWQRGVAALGDGDGAGMLEACCWNARKLGTEMWAREACFLTAGWGDCRCGGGGRVSRSWESWEGEGASLTGRAEEEEESSAKEDGRGWAIVTSEGRVGRGRVVQIDEQSSLTAATATGCP